MAIQLSYTDEMGATHSDAYARITALKLRLEPLNAVTVTISIWHNAAARSKSDAAAQKKIVTDITYEILDSNFDTYAADAVVKANNISLMSNIYTWLKTHTDGTAERSDAGVRLINQGNGINWTTATDV